MLKYISAILLSVVAALTISCSDWTETESIELNRPSVEESNPELYAEYLAALQGYKSRAHKHLYATFDNSVKSPFNRSHHLTRLPDSLDVVSLISSDNLHPWEQEEIETIRMKGTKVVYTINYSTLELRYADEKKAADEAQVAPADDEGGEDTEKPVFPSFTEWAADKLATQLDLCDHFGYDGVTLNYNGLSTMNMTAAQLEEYTVRQQFLLSSVSTWINSHTEKIFIFQGLPQNLLDRTILQQARYIILPTQSSTSIDGLEKEVIMAIRNDVPTDRFLIAVNTISLDPSDALTGRFDVGASITEAAYWVVGAEKNYTKMGLAIFQIQNDYFSTSQLYHYTRNAATIMNPSPKN